MSQNSKYRIVAIIGCLLWVVSVVYGSDGAAEVLLRTLSNVVGVFLFIIGYGLLTKNIKDGQV